MTEKVRQHGGEPEEGSAREREKERERERQTERQTEREKRRGEPPRA